MEGALRQRLGGVIRRWVSSCLFSVNPGTAHASSCLFSTRIEHPGTRIRAIEASGGRNIDPGQDNPVPGSKIKLEELSFSPGIADKPIASPAVARFRRMAISAEAQELLEILDAGMAEVRDRKLGEYYGKLSTDIVVDVLNHASDVEATIQFFEWCHGRHGYTHTAFAFNRLLEFLVNKRQYKRAHQFLLAENKPFFFQPNSFTYSTIIRGYCEEGETKQALALLDHMHKNEVPANAKLYNIILTHLCKHGKDKEALELLHAMTEACPPDIFTYNILINALCKVGKLDDAQGLVEMMQARGCPMDIVTFNTLIHGLCRKGSGRFRAERALKLFEEMIDKGYVPTSVTYTVVIDALLRVKLDDQAQKVLDLMNENRCAFDLITYNTLINRFAKAGLMDKAMDLFLEMPTRGCIPDVVTYNCIVDGLCKAGQVDEAIKFFTDMKLRGVFPNGRTFTSITDACLKSGRMQEAHSYLIEMRKHGLADEISYIALISTISKLGKGKLAFQLLREMIDKGFKPNLVTFNAVFEAMNKEGSIDDARSMLSELRQHCAPPTKG